MISRERFVYIMVRPGSLTRPRWDYSSLEGGDRERRILEKILDAIPINMKTILLNMQVLSISFYLYVKFIQSVFSI